MSAPFLQLHLTIFDAQLTAVASGVLRNLSASSGQVRAHLQLTLGDTSHEIELSGKPIEIPTGGVTLLNGTAAHLAVSLSLIMGVYIPAYSGGILLSNGALNLPFNLIATPNAPMPVAAGTTELLAKFVQQLKQLEVQ